MRTVRKLDLLKDFAVAGFIGAMAGGGAYHYTTEPPAHDNPAYVEYTGKILKAEAAGSGVALAGYGAFLLAGARRRKNHPAPSND